MSPALHPESGGPLPHWVLKREKPSKPLPRSNQTLPPIIDIVGFIPTGSVAVSLQIFALGHGQVMGLVVGADRDQAERGRGAEGFGALSGF